MKLNEPFRRFSARISKLVGSSPVFIAALVLVGAWIVAGLATGFTDSWLLLINTVSSVTTFLVVFLIQNTQNRHIRVMQLKLDELIKAQRSARNDLMGMEEFTDQELDALQQDFQQLSSEFKHRRKEIIERHLHNVPHKTKNAR